MDSKSPGTVDATGVTTQAASFSTLYRVCLDQYRDKDETGDISALSKPRSWILAVSSALFLGILTLCYVALHA